MMRRVFPSAAVVGAFLAVLVFAPIAGAAFPGNNGKVAFHTNRDGNFEIYTVTSDGSAVFTRLTNNAADDVTPAWSADGTKIAWVSLRDGNYEIYTMNANGSGLLRITNNAASDVQPAWSADSTKITFTTNRDGNFEVYTMNADGTNPVGITNNPASDGQSNFSPDGTKMVFQSNRDGNFEIYTMNADGTSQARITNNAATDEYPNWFSDGTKIAFDSDRSGQFEVYYMNSDGSTVQPITTGSTTKDFAVTMSPQGPEYVYTRSTSGGATDLIEDNLGPELGFNLSSGNPASDEFPDWQPLNNTYARPKGASPFRIALVPAYKQCPSSPTPPTTHRGSITAASCYQPTPESSYLTVGSPESSGTQANYVGSVLFKAQASPADGTITVSNTDIRCQGSTGGCAGGVLSDYTGQMSFNATFRITDKGNGPVASGPSTNGTVTDLPFQFTVPCSATPAAPNVGSTCSITTTINTVLGSSAIVAGRRAIWQLNDLRLFDAGSDGVASTPGSTLFAVGGLFFP
jgi:Tol biopolymer transport system component